MNQLIDILVKNQAKIATAESCTGGGIAQLLTERAGSSAWFDQGWVTYTLAAKHKQLGVSYDTLKLTTVSAEVATQMAVGALARSAAQVAVAVTGVAGPSGGAAAHPVGCCWFGFAFQKALWSYLQIPPNMQGFDSLVPESFHLTSATLSRCLTVRCDFPGDRALVRKTAIDFALHFCASVLVAGE